MHAPCRPEEGGRSIALSNSRPAAAAGTGEYTCKCMHADVQRAAAQYHDAHQVAYFHPRELSAGTTWKNKRAPRRLALHNL